MIVKSIRLSIGILFLFFFSTSLFAQQYLDGFQGLVSEGDIPKEFISSSSSKYKALEKKVKEKKKVGKKQKKFYLESSFAIDELLKSGEVLYGDPISNYVNKVADELLKSNPNLRKKLRFYVVKSAGVNAFATDRGSIFVNLGLLSRLETEAQLAFVLAHEIVHYQHKHNMDGFLEFQEIDAMYKRQKKSYDQLLEKSNYSQKLEEEADEEGMEIFAESNYSVSSLTGIYDIMGTAHVGFSDVAFDKSYLEIYGAVIPDSLMLDSVNTISKYMDSEELSSHPSLNDRRAKMVERFGAKSDSKQDYLVGEALFKKARDLARFDVCNILVANRSFSAAIYYSFALEQEYGKSDYLDAIRAKSLYGLAQYANEDMRDNLPVSPDDIQGNMQQAFHILDKLEPKELSALAAAHVWQYHRDHPKDEAFRLRANDMIADLYKFYIDDNKNFFIVKGKESDSFVEGIFADAKSNSDFQKMVKEGDKKRNQYRKHEDKFEYLEQFTKGYKKKQNAKLKKGTALDVDKILFVNPMYMRVDKRKKVPVRYIESENQQEVFVDKLEKVAKQVNLKTEILDVNSLNKRSTSVEFNETVTVNKWVGEFWRDNVEMIPSNHGDMLKLTNKYGTSDIAYAGVLSLSERTLSTTLLYSYAYVWTGVLAPFAYHYPLSAKDNTIFFWISFDTENFEITHSEIINMRMKSADAVLESNIYWMMDQMKRKR